MKIAVLGWGSLIWSPDKLKLSNGEWHPDGPFLPVEFARVSRDKRLTLVLYPGAEPVQVLWAESACPGLEEMVANLAKREGTTEQKIGYYFLDNDSYRCGAVPEIMDDIKNWLTTTGFDAVVWTDLPSNFFERTGMSFSHDNAVTYLRSLEEGPCRKAREYMVKAPKQVATPVRRHVEKTLNWRP